MTDEGRRYVTLAAELKKKLPGDPPRTEIVGEMDRIWQHLSDLERDEVDGLLIAVDEVERTGKGFPPADLSDNDDNDHEQENT